MTPNLETNQTDGMYEFGALVGAPVDYEAGLRSEVWTKHYYYQCACDPVNPKIATVAAAPTVIKVCEYDEGKWAWIGLGERVRLKVHFPSDVADGLGLVWGKNRKVLTSTQIFVVSGEISTTDDGHITLDNPVFADIEDVKRLGIEMYVAAVVMSFSVHLDELGSFNS